MKTASPTPHSIAVIPTTPASPQWQAAHLSLPFVGAIRCWIVMLFCFVNLSPLFAQAAPIVAEFQWAVQAAGSEGRAIAVDPMGNTYITGGNNLLAKYDPNGNLIWARQIGGAGSDRRFSIALDAQGRIFFTGSFVGTVSFGGISLTSAGGSDIFIAKYDNDGNALWAKRAGGPADDTGAAIAVDGAGSCYVTGLFYRFFRERRGIFHRGQLKAAAVRG